MNPVIATFCWRAVKRGILTTGQCLVLRELFDEGANLSDCVNFIAKNSIVDGSKLKALKLQMTAAPQEVPYDPVNPPDAIEDLIEKEIAGERKWEPDPGLEWFCCLAIEKGLLTKEICLCLAADLQDVNDLLSFAQAVVDTGLCKDLLKVQTLTDEALEQWAQGNPVPYPVLSGDV